MAVICPTITATDSHAYRQQMERIEQFAERIHVDFMDGVFAPTTSVSLNEAWWKDSEKVDVHLMFKKPMDSALELIALNPRLVIVHAEADGNFVEFAAEMHQHGIKAGVALLADTDADKIQPALDYIDHVLVFSGDLGHFGGVANLDLLQKVHKLKEWKPELEIGWDGGINEGNVAQLAAAGVEVLNVGGFIQNADDPREAHDILKQIIRQQT